MSNKKKRNRRGVLDEGLAQAIMSHKLRIDFSPRDFSFSDKQRDLFDILLNDSTKIAFVAGPAGTSKTYCAVYAALHSLREDIDLYREDSEFEIMYIRSLIESASKGLGALPGDLDEKFAPFIMPFEDKLMELLPKETLPQLRTAEKYSCIPVNFVRGASWNEKFVVVDEAQNFTESELTTIITRIGRGSKVVFCGDMTQSDIGSKSGFKKFYDTFNDQESKEHGIHTFEFTENDIYRDEILKFIVNKLKKNKKS